MSRNRKDMSAAIFLRIDVAASEKDPEYVADANFRWIARKDAADAQLMAEAKVTSLPLGMRTMAASVEHGGKRIFCFSGLPIPSEAPLGLVEIDATPGLFASVVFETDLRAQTTAAQARDVLQEQHHGIEGYNGHDLMSIMGLFPELRFFEASAQIEVPYIQSLERVTGSYVSRGYPGYPLNLETLTLVRLTELFEAGPDTVPYHLPLQGIFSYNWPALFLDLYRCLEQLYSAPRLSILSKNVVHNGSLADLSLILETTLSWRPREEESLSAIFEKTSEGTRKSLISAICEANSVLDPTGEKCAAHIYKLRNSHVHFRPALQAPQLETRHWNIIIQAMCDAICESYEHFGTYFLRVKSGE